MKTAPLKNAVAFAAAVCGAGAARSAYAQTPTQPPAPQSTSAQSPSEEVSPPPSDPNEFFDNSQKNIGRIKRVFLGLNWDPGTALSREIMSSFGTLQAKLSLTGFNTWASWEPYLSVTDVTGVVKPAFGFDVRFRPWTDNEMFSPSLRCGLGLIAARNLQGSCGFGVEYNERNLRLGADVGFGFYLNEQENGPRAVGVLSTNLYGGIQF